MMVVHKDIENLVDVSEQNLNISVKNHVKELSNTTQNTTNSGPNEKKSLGSSRHKGSKKKRKYKKHNKPREIPSSSESDDNNHTATEIDASDLNELKTVYTQCKGSSYKIYSTYKPSLNLNNDEGSSEYFMKKTICSESNEGKCHFKSKNEIVFDDEDEMPTTSSVSDDFIKTAAEIVASDLNELESVYTKCEEVMKKIEPVLNVHSEEGSSGCRMTETIYSESNEDECNRNQKTNNVSTATTTPLHRNNAVQYQEPILRLPQNLIELRQLLKDPDLEDTFRNRICQRIKLLKTYQRFDIKDEKRNLIKQSKLNPDKVLNFKGTNLSLISGYSIY